MNFYFLLIIPLVLIEAFLVRDYLVDYLVI